MRLTRISGLFLFVCAVVAIQADFAQESRWYPFARSYSIAQTVAARIAPPPGYVRVPAVAGSFAAWLRGLPLKPGRPQVRLFNGQLKAYQAAHYAVLDIDTGTRDLQQCADAAMRLRAEYLRASGHADDIAFNFTSGDRMRWADWRRGVRPVVTGNRVTWQARAVADDSPASFRQYLDTVFTYAGSQSLEREMEPVADTPIEPGHVFVHGGAPGHAVIVVDVARKADGSAVFLLAQSYMPAQDIHILVNPGNADSGPCYRDVRGGNLETPEWAFPPNSLRRFRE